jgi:CBS domain-containing protein
MNVGELCSRDLVSVAAGTPLLEVAKAMRDEHVGIVVVTKAPADEQVAAGVVTDRDIARAWADHGAVIAEFAVERVMTRDPLVLNEEDSIDKAVSRMRGRGVRRAPVVTRHGRLLGLVSIDDLIAHAAGELSGIARLLEQQPRQERH